jgi:hypothetical protein
MSTVCDREFNGLRGAFYAFRTEMNEFRLETSANFDRLERRGDRHDARIDDHEERITTLEKNPG